MTAGWIPVALGKDVPPGTTRSAVVDDQELVIWRGADGEAHVWEDRCPHRGMRLSFGFVRENALSCLYHGWQYGAGAQCMRIPAHPDLAVPASIRAKARTTVETGGMIWTRVDVSTEGAPPELPPGTAPLASLAVAADPDMIRTAAAGASNALGPQILSLSHSDGILHVGWHLVRTGKTMLHAVVETGGHDVGMRRLRALRAEAEERAAG